MIRDHGWIQSITNFLMHVKIKTSIITLAKLKAETVRYFSETIFLTISILVSIPCFQGVSRV